MRVRLNNVGIINQCDVEFIPGINLIVGSSGSGKSTLMRCLYNMATNDFSDSDISFGQNTMIVRIDIDDNVVEYGRSIKAKGERCYYKVNGETYVKLGRTALPSVAEALRIGDIDVNGEDVNFNFNLQFSSPFLILGNQATLYNVLTYRSTFDLSSINDYYNTDIKANASEIISNTKLKENLESSLELLENQAQQLSPIEKLYGDYISYKHKAELLDDLRSLFEKMNQVNSIKNNVEELLSTLSHVDSAITIISALNDIHSHSTTCKLYNTVCNNIELYSSLIDRYSKAILSVDSISSLTNLLSEMKQNESLNMKISLLNSCINSSKNILNKEEFLIDVVKQKARIYVYNKCSAITELLSSTNDTSISDIGDLLYVKEKLHSLLEVNNSIKSVKRKCTMAHNKLAKFGVCPLCGNHLEMHEESLDE